MNILIIDDDKLIHKVISHALDPLGHKTFSAVNGKEAQNFILKERDIDVIICDILMPQLSGPDFIASLKHYYSRWMPTVIVISSMEEGNEVFQKSGLKFNYFINKPFDVSYLTGIIEHIQNIKK